LYEKYIGWCELNLVHIILFVGIHHFRDVGTDGRIILKSLILVNVAMNYEVSRNGKFVN